MASGHLPKLSDDLVECQENPFGTEEAKMPRLNIILEKYFGTPWSRQGVYLHVHS